MPTEISRPADALTTYLNDHLAGSVAALHLLDHLSASAGVPEDAEFFRRLRADIDDDRRTLETLLEKCGGRVSGVRQLGGWIAEKLGRVKLMLDDPSRGTFERLEALEILVLGIHGKQLMWRALAAVALPGLSGVDFNRLEHRAEEQHNRVEARRLDSARRVLSSSN